MHDVSNPNNPILIRNLSDEQYLLQQQGGTGTVSDSQLPGKNKNKNKNNSNNKMDDIQSGFMSDGALLLAANKNKNANETTNNNNQQTRHSEK